MNDSNKNLRCSEWLFKFLRLKEGLKLEAYRCPAGKWTIGYGSTVGVKEGDRISESTANAKLYTDATRAANIVRRWVNVPLSVPQLEALTSFVFNVGGGPFQRSTLLKKLNAGDTLGAMAQFQFWNKRTVGNVLKVTEGLTIRRMAEYKRFSSTVLPCNTDSQGRITPKARKLGSRQF